MQIRHAIASATAMLASITAAPQAIAQSTPPPSWRASVQTAVAASATLQSVTPSDIAAFCPTFSALDAPARAVFWTNFLTDLANAESQGDPSRTRWLPFDRVMGRPTFRRGLFQISIEAANSARYQCEASNGAALADANTNAACAVRILTVDVGAGGAISDAGHYWPTLGRGARRNALAANVAAQPPCGA